MEKEREQRRSQPLRALPLFLLLPSSPSLRRRRQWQEQVP